MLVLATLFALCTLGAKANQDNPCILERLNSEDLQFCRGGLEIIYHGLDASCNVIPDCANYRQNLMMVWGPPIVKFPNARLDKKYVLIMVDPDAPNRVDPIYRFWKHWLVADIKGQDLLTGTIRGNILTAYRRPNPPKDSGYHRYQIFIYLQPEGKDIKTISSKRASWDMVEFVHRFHLETPKATGQFMVANL